MKEKVGEVFSIAKDNAPVPGCTISKQVYAGDNSITYFSLARNTDISAEIYPYYKLIVMAEGSMAVYGVGGYERRLAVGEGMLTPTDTPVGMRTADAAVYTEITIGRNDTMNEAIKAGEVFRLAELVPYVEGKIVNMDVVHNVIVRGRKVVIEAPLRTCEGVTPWNREKAFVKLSGVS